MLQTFRVSGGGKKILTLYIFLKDKFETLN